MKRSNQLYFAALAIILDVLTLVAILTTLPRLTSMMNEPSGVNALLVAVTFLLFTGGVFIFRRMKATPDGSTEWLSRRQRAALALGFAFFLSLTLAWQLGFFESAFQADTTQMGEGGASSYFVTGPGAWLAFSLIYVLVFAFNVEPGIDYGARGYWVSAVIGLLFTVALLVVTAAQAHVIAAVIGGSWWYSFLAFLILTLMFLPPRLLYLSRTTGLRSTSAYATISIFVVLLAYLAAQVAF